MTFTDSASQHYKRFSLAQRSLHAVLAITFLGLAATGLPLKFTTAAWALAFARTIGGFGTILFFHLLCAVTMTIAFLIHVGNLAYRVITKREYTLIWGPTSMVPQLQDIKDLFAHLRWFLWLGPKPTFDRYAYWDKFDYWAVFWGMAIIGFSGYAMWFAPLFARLIPGSWLNVALVIHGEEGLLAVSFIFLIHFFNTHLRPHNFPMDLAILTGIQSEEEFKLRHPKEYDRLKQAGKLERLKAGPPTVSEQNFSFAFGLIAVVIGLVLIGLTAVAFFS
jgi:cytochrome b subunit of formate dehydrogenase